MGNVEADVNLEIVQLALIGCRFGVLIYIVVEDSIVDIA